MKTDSAELYEFTLEVIAENKLPLLDSTNDLYGNVTEERIEVRSIKTYYERLFTEQGKKITYLKFQL